MRMLVGSSMAKIEMRMRRTVVRARVGTNKSSIHVYQISFNRMKNTKDIAANPNRNDIVSKKKLFNHEKHTLVCMNDLINDQHTILRNNLQNCQFTTLNSCYIL